MEKKISRGIVVRVSYYCSYGCFEESWLYASLSLYIKNTGYFTLIPREFQYRSILPLVKEGDVVSFSADDSGFLSSFTNHTLTGN